MFIVRYSEPGIANQAYSEPGCYNLHRLEITETISDRHGQRSPLWIIGAQGQTRTIKGIQSQKHDFEITNDPKGPQRRPTFWSGFEAPDP